MKRTIVGLISWIGLMTITGCVGKGEVIPLQLQSPTVHETQAQRADKLLVAIHPFEDGRSYQTGLGVRTHLWGGVSYFDVPGGKPGDAVTQALSDYLTAKGWRVTKPGPNGDTDVAIAGKLEECFVQAKSRIGFTTITARTKLTIHATNSSDGSVVRMVLNGSGVDDVFWFHPEDVQTLVNDILTDSFHKLLQDTRVENDRLRLNNP